MRQFKCPYYVAFEGKVAIQCVMARLKFLDEETWTDYADTYCDNTEGYQNCSLCKVLLAEYERNDKQHKPQTKFNIID